VWGLSLAVQTQKNQRVEKSFAKEFEEQHMSILKSPKIKSHIIVLDTIPQKGSKIINEVFGFGDFHRYHHRLRQVHF